MTIILDPANLKKEEAEKLEAFFEEESKKNIRHWVAGKNYTFSDKTNFQFPLEVFQRQRKEDGTGRPKEGFRYDFISQRKLGSGGMSDVYIIEGTLGFNMKDNRQYKPKGYHDRTRVVKIQDALQCEGHWDVETEYLFTLLAGHLSVKPVTIVGKTSYMTMRKMADESLADLLYKLRYRRITLSAQQRLDISRALLKAVKTQVTDKDIIHRDLKGENIIIDLSTAPPLANTIDFGCAIMKGYPDGIVAGTPAYQPYESRHDDYNLTAKADVYSVARVLALLWNVDTDSYDNPRTDVFAHEDREQEKILDTLFSNITDLDDSSRIKIKETLFDMLRKNVEQRISIDEAIKRFANICLIRHHIPINKLLKKLSVLQEQADKLNERGETSTAKKLRDLTIDLEERLNSLKDMQPEDYQANIQRYIVKCRTLIKEEEKTFQHHRNSNYILANIAWGILSLGSAFIVNYACNRHFFFHTETKSNQLLAQLDKGFEQVERENKSPLINAV